MISPQVLRCRRLVCGAVVVVAAGWSVAWASGAEADADRPSFTGVASAQGGRFTFTVPGYAAAEELADGGGPVAQSYFDSSTSTSFASLPWPGENGVTLPGVTAAFTGQRLPAEYPLYVLASRSTTPEEVRQDPVGLYSLAAKATESTTSGAAQLAGDGPGTSGGTRALTSVVVDGATVTVSAENRNEVISLGDGALRIASVMSRSITRQMGAEAPTTVTELAVQAATANGMALAYGHEGLVVGSQGVALPVGTGLQQFNQALEPFHLSVRFVSPQPIVGGASAGVFEVVSHQPSPNPEIPPSILKIVFGGATSAVVVEGSNAAPLSIADEESTTGREEFSSAPAVSPGVLRTSNGLLEFASEDGATGSPVAGGFEMPEEVTGPEAVPGGDRVALAATPVMARPTQLTFERGSRDPMQTAYGAVALTGVVVLSGMAVLWLRPNGMLRQRRDLAGPGEQACVE